ncbi:MAG: hypothetical protein JNL09_08085 [Anaerolineales bacterium]|nr:hypothetical protein [Anaerolineales bacterium]
MPATYLSLRALRHPLTLLSIALLLLNDHWLKAAAPSVLTGKLSDFAGLFFFPFLLAALLGTARLPARLTFLLALTLTGGWFALMKTTLWANALTRAALSAVWGGPVSIVLDPTDCWALVMLLPAWLLWRSLERERAPQPSGKLALAALCVAALAMLADQPPTFYWSYVVRLTADESKVYARLEDWEKNGTDLVESSDGGASWKVADTVSDVVSATLRTPLSYPITDCLPDNIQICYQLPDENRVEKSLDGGKTWQTTWQYPKERLEFIRRVKIAGPLERDLVDLTILGNSHGYSVIVASGNEGIVIIKPDNSWERYAVMGALPTRLQATSIQDALAVISPELIALPFWIFIIWFALSLSVWAKISNETGKLSTTVNLGKLFLLLLTLATLVFLVPSFANPYMKFYDVLLFPGQLTLLFIGYSFGLFFVPNWLPITMIYVATIAVCSVLWLRASSFPPNPRAAAKLGWLITGFALGLLLLGWLPFVLWAFGIIPLYEMALALAAVLIALLLWRTWPKRISLRSQALTPPAV